jgi:hypothetical protein
LNIISEVDDIRYLITNRSFEFTSKDKNRTRKVDALTALNLFEQGRGIDFDKKISKPFIY